MFILDFRPLAVNTFTDCFLLGEYKDSLPSMLSSLLTIFKISSLYAISDDNFVGILKAEIKFGSTGQIMVYHS